MSCTACDYSEPYPDADGVMWITVHVISTTPPGSLVRWTKNGEGIIAECAEGGTIEVLDQVMTGELYVAIVKPIVE